MEHIRLAPHHAAFVEEHVASVDYATPDEYVAALIDSAGRVEAEARLDALLVEGLESEELEWTPELMEQIKRDSGLRR